MCINATPIPTPEVSISMTNDCEEYNMASSGVIHITCLRSFKAHCVALDGKGIFTYMPITRFIILLVSNKFYNIIWDLKIPRNFYELMI